MNRYQHIVKREELGMDWRGQSKMYIVAKCNVVVEKEHNDEADEPCPRCLGGGIFYKDEIR